MSSSPPSLKSDVTLSLTLSSPNSDHHTLKSEKRDIKLIQLLLTYANQASSGNLQHADACLHKISSLASVSSDSMQRLVARFASALAVRLVRHWSGLFKAPKPCWANERVIHIVDLGSGDPKMWLPLLRSFAKIAHGPPHMKMTCVHSNKVVLDKLGAKLVKEVDSLDMPFQFNAVNVSLRELTIEMLKVRSSEALAFTFILNLHTLLAENDRVNAHFEFNKNDGITYSKQISDFLTMVQSMLPKVMLLIEQESDHNLSRLVDRFVEGLHYYSALFDSIDVTFGRSSSEERIILEEMFGS